jgi:3-deoxy-manno-octulosonate cytidylyltransferase (CMP-KDO synthetase)
MQRVLGVIPARFASTRFPGKPLASLGDKSMIEQVWLAARGASRLDRLIIATDDRRIADEAARFGAEIMMTSPDHASGTDRVAEVVRSLDDGFAIVVNVQGDEPLLTPTSIDRLLEVFDDPSPVPEMATLAEPITSVDELFDANVVKVVTDSRGRALYFSRSPIPYHRGSGQRLPIDFPYRLAGRDRALTGYRKHQGIYAYTRQALLSFTHLEPSPLERDEGLEQLRALEAGFTIQVVDSDFRSQPVDTPADLERVAKFVTEAN